MAKKTKKRGVKPGTKRGKYKSKRQIVNDAIHKLSQGTPSVNMAAIKDYTGPTTPQILNLCGQLEEAIVLLETRLSNAIAKINSLMGNI